MLSRLLFLVYFSATVWGYKENLAPLAANSLYIPYLDQDLRIRHWEYGGSTMINTQRYIRLTPEKKGRSGWLWNKVVIPVILKGKKY